jgi:GT2 family glycosyltransferase
VNIEHSKTLCVILHHGSEEYTNKCISSLLNQKQLDIVILDNDPSQSYEPLAYARKSVKIFKTGGSAGFSESNNIGVKAFLTKYHSSILILNNDTIVSEGALEYLLNTLNSSSVGAVGPCMPYTSHPNKIWACGGNISKLRVSIGGIQPKHQRPYEVDYLPAAAILCRSDLWKEIGGFNEEYFIAYEEAEFALEIKKRGFKVMVDPRSVILHTVGMSNQISAKYYYNSIRNRLIFSKYLYGKNIGFFYALIITTLSFLNARSLKNFLQRIKLWIKAISDDFNKVPIDRKILQSITEQFEDNY